MTAHKHRKALVRQRAGRTGESYTAALQHLRTHQVEDAMETTTWRRIDKPDFGYAFSVPEGWVETPPNLKNSPWWEVRFADPEDRRRDCVVFRQPVIAGQTAADVVANVRTHLKGYGFGAFVVENVSVASRQGVCLDFAKSDAGRTWSCQEYFVVNGDTCFCVGFGTSTLTEDRPLIEAIVGSFAIVPVP